MNFRYENKKIKQGFTHVVGCDEVGRGCLAGPVVAAAVIYNAECRVKSAELRGIRDSKLLSPDRREELSKIIKQNFLWSIAEVAPKIVDKINIHNASLLAMKKAVKKLLSANSHELAQEGHSVSIPEDLSASERLSGIQSLLGPGSRVSDALARDGTTFLFIDGKFPISKFDVEQQAIVGGDNKVLSIAAASIIAKVYRDQLMREFGKQYPNYNFSQHKGYATEHHRAMVAKHGLSPIHRVSFCKNIIVLKTKIRSD